jgi:hypothetical protein
MTVVTKCRNDVFGTVYANNRVGLKFPKIDLF